MNDATFTHLLKQLVKEDWQAVIDGRSIVIVDDLSLQVGSESAPNAVIRAPEHGDSDADTLMRDSIANAASLLNNYYLTHPLTLVGFNRQTERLIEEHGAHAFAALIGQFPQRTLFVERGVVIAEPHDSPRHRYGVFCELSQPLPDDIDAYVRNWLQRGEAHEHYLGMNVCRYNC